jgi:hypothetical protein
MAAMTSYLQKKLLDHAIGKAAYTMPVSVTLSLHTASPTDTGSTADEVSTVGTGYGRVSITSLMNVTDSSTGVASNSSVITFGPATADWGTIAYVAINDTLGNMLMYGALDEVQTTPLGETVQFSPGQFIAQFD